MTDGTVIGAALIVLVLLFLRFGDTVTDVICRTIDPAPDIIEEHQPNQ